MDPGGVRSGVKEDAQVMTMSSASVAATATAAALMMSFTPLDGHLAPL